MRGTTHAMSGAAAGTAVGLLAPSPALSVTCVAVAAVAALGPDIDHPRSHAAQAKIALGVVVGVLLHVLDVPPQAVLILGVAVAMGGLTVGVRGLSRVLGLPAHRGLSHTVMIAIFAGVAVGAVLLVLGAVVMVAALIGGAVVVGWLTALAGDWVTKTSLPHLWWPFIAESHGPPRWLRITTGKWMESVIMWLVFVPATCFGLWLILLR